ncbi:MAG: fuconate dehydratase [Actinobacteria bacterium]|uniref:L-fuconate dehydratase n=1 Tax=Candidatus Fonsibacter lacus TaxID=2576439 RepID=A0A965GCM3_9PROT|nr:fuconate dehydratase [Candidatus Fonsibacter lacus]
MATITGFRLADIRFPTSRSLDGSDAMNKDPDYSAAYLILETDTGIAGHGFAFTLGRGTELQCATIELLAPKVVGRKVAELKRALGEISRELVSDSQIRWLGPEKGLTHMAVGAVLTALWDIVAKHERKPLWEVLSDMSPEEIVELVDFRYIRDVLSPEEAVEILKRAEPTKAERKAKLLKNGIPAYTTSPGWLGYSDEKMVRLAKEAVADGFTLIKLKCGGSIEDDKRRLKLAREAVGPNIRLAIDANQVWSVDEAISWLNELQDKSVDLYWIEEPTSPDDALGHATIAKAIAPIRVATGEHVQNRIIFKQMLQLGAFSFMQIDSTRVAGPNENIANILMAAKFGIPVCPHAGGVGLCELVQHLSMFDYVAVSGENDARVIEFVDHLHEHFVTPVKIERGRYLAPVAPGGGGEMFPESIKRFTFPNGEEWR